MIYINEQNIDKINMPLHFANTGVTYTLELTNTLDKSVITTTVENSSTNSRIYQFDLSAIENEFKTGTYEYKLILGTETLEMGIAQFGEYETTTVQYVGKNNKYIQYTR
jgi:hypothetical protein